MSLHVLNDENEQEVKETIVKIHSPCLEKISEMSIIQGKNLQDICNLMLLQRRVKEFDGNFKVEGSKLVCVFCNQKLDYKQKPVLQKHLSSKNHIQKQRMLQAKLVRVIEDHDSDSKDESISNSNSNDQCEPNKKERKRKKTLQEKIEICLKLFGNVLKQEGEDLVCIYCGNKYKYNQKITIKRHIASKLHENNVSLKNFEANGGEPPTRRKKTNASAAQVEFNIELCKVFLVSGIPISKLSHPIVQKFFTKYTTMTIPVESTLRKSYLEPARLTLQAEAQRLTEELLNKKNKKPGTKGKESKKRKRNESSDDEEDPLIFTEEQLQSMLALKVEPKEEPVEEPIADSFKDLFSVPGRELEAPLEPKEEPKEDP